VERSDSTEPLRLVAIDPGSDTLGVALFHFNLVTYRIELKEVETLLGHRNAKIDPEFAATHGDRIARLRSHKRVLYRYFERTKPHRLVSEAPFMGKHAAAYAALVECCTYIRQALETYDTEIPYRQIDPPTVKRGIGAMGNADKEAVKKQLLKVTHVFDNYSGKELADLDEHSIDAIAVGLTELLRMTGQYLEKPYASA
jgi:Holliday junction resolvasome RuvABC endonuclease subunit